MNRRSRFSYQCRECGRCCHDQVITLSPYDLISIARAAAISTGDAVRRYTIRRGSILKFTSGGGCAALDGTRCMIHSGRPLACRLYPLGLERGHGGERFIRLDAAPASHGIYGDAGVVEDFLSAQGVGPALEIIECYRRLLVTMRRRIDALTDFERIEPREFWRRATREALAETNYDPNPLIDALFDPDASAGHMAAPAAADTVASHIRALAHLVIDERDPERLAAAAVLLAVSLGYTPAEAITAGA